MGITGGAQVPVAGGTADALTTFNMVNWGQGATGSDPDGPQRQAMSARRQTRASEHRNAAEGSAFVRNWLQWLH